MKSLPGDVFVTGQISPEQIEQFSERGIQSLINNRPEGEALMQPEEKTLENKSKLLNLNYKFIPMAQGLTPEIIAQSREAYQNLPRPIVTWCASGMRSAVLWGFAHVDVLGVDGVMTALAEAGFSLEQIRTPLTQYAQNLDGEKNE